MGFQWLNLTSLTGPTNTTGSNAISTVTSSAVSNVLSEEVAGGSIASLVYAGTVNTTNPSAAVSASASQVTSSSGLLFTTTGAHNLSFGLVVQFTTSNALPTGISLATNYWVVPISATTYKVATSLANAIAGTVVAYTNTGTGNQTATAVAISGATVKLQGSNDNQQTWFDVPNSSQSITASGSFVFELDYVRYAAFRSKIDLTTGQIVFTANQIGYKGA